MSTSRPGKTEPSTSRLSPAPAIATLAPEGGGGLGSRRDGHPRAGAVPETEAGRQGAPGRQDAPALYSPNDGA